MIWDGAVNLHHVGGDVYRMARHEWLTTGGWRHAFDDGIRTVIDLRGAPERVRRDTDPELEPTALQGIRIVQAPTEDPDDPEFRATMVPYLDHPAGYADYLRIFPDRVRAAFGALADAEGAVVIHCSAGRDRTGLIAAMAQELAGVSRGAILDGYAAAARGINDHLRTRTTPHPHERTLADRELGDRIADQQSALSQFLDGIDVQTWLAAGLSAAQIESLAARLHP